MQPTETKANNLRSTTRQTALLLGIAFLLRLWIVAVVLEKYPAGWLFTRGMEMASLAHSVLTGHGLSSPFGGTTGPTAFLAPGYPLMVAAIFGITGSYSAASAICIMLLNGCANLLTVYLILHLACRLSGHIAALIVGTLWSCSPPLLWMPTIFWETSLSTCLLLGAIALVLHLRQNTKPGHWLLLGSYCAIGGLINPALLPSLAAILLWLVVQTPARQRRQAMLSLTAFLVVFSPWPIRNARVFHAFIPLRTTVGYELWMGNRPGATGYLDESLFPTFNKTELDDYVARGELGYTRRKSALAMDSIRTHPETFARLTATRVVRYWGGSGTRGGSPIFMLHGVLTATLGFAGLALVVHRRQLPIAILLAIPLLLFPLPYFVTHAEFRYRLVIDPLLTVLSAVPIAAGWKRISSRRVASLGLPPSAEKSQALFA